MKKLMRNSAINLIFLLIMMSAQAALADEGATPQEVFQHVVKAAEVVKVLGEESFPAFNNLKGEFAWKDTYVFVFDCKKLTTVAHPMSDVVGLPADKLKCKKSGKKILIDACNNTNPKGYWQEYWWPKRGETTSFRKVCLFIPVEGTNLFLGCGIYNKTTPLSDLNKLLQ